MVWVNILKYCQYITLSIKDLICINILIFFKNDITLKVWKF